MFRLDPEKLARWRDRTLVALSPRSRIRTAHGMVIQLREFYENDMRWSYYLSAALIVTVVLSSIFFEHGWTLGPFAMVIGALSMVHEAAERNGQGVPPFHAYLLVLGIILVWSAIALICSILHPVIMALGLIAIGYQCARGYIQEQERNELIVERRKARCCIFCGTQTEIGYPFCPGCGEEPDPAGTRLGRVRNIVELRKNSLDTRAILTPKPPTAGVAAKERALLDRRLAVKVRRHS
jgi:hypothetical protein